MKRLALLQACCALACLRPGPPTAAVLPADAAHDERRAPVEPATEQSTILGKVVTRAEADAFVKTLTDVRDWSCAETSQGGIVRYRARDKKGRWYQVTATSPGGTRVEPAAAAP